MVCSSSIHIFFFRVCLLIPYISVRVLLVHFSFQYRPALIPFHFLQIYCLPSFGPLWNNAVIPSLESVHQTYLIRLLVTYLPVCSIIFYGRSLAVLESYSALSPLRVVNVLCVHCLHEIFLSLHPVNIWWCISLLIAWPSKTHFLPSPSSFSHD